MKRRIFELWEQCNYLLALRTEYVSIKKRSFVRSSNQWGIVKNGRKIILGLLVVIITILGILLGYKYPSVGFSDFTSPSGEFQRGKTIWDWIQLIATPLFLSIIAYYLTSAQREKELAVTQTKKREEVLQNYFDYMTRLLVEQDYSDEEVFEGASRFIRARTLTTLEMLNGAQKGYVLRFLIEAGLLNSEQPYLSMKRANFSKSRICSGARTSVRFDPAKSQTKVCTPLNL